MTVKALIEELQKLPLDLQVCYRCASDGNTEWEVVTSADIANKFGIKGAEQVVLLDW